MDQEKLYELAFAYRETKLWKKLYDTELFAVVLPGGEIGYCCVMGHLGEHLALSLYVGEEGLNSLRMLRDQGDGVRNVQEFLLAQNCLQCAFGNKDDLSPEELSSVRAYAAKHKLSFRGKNAFPQFMKYRAAHIPWPISEEADMEMLGAALRGALAVSTALAERGSKMERGFQDALFEDRPVPLLTPSQDGFTWSMHALPPYSPPTYPQPVIEDELLLMRLKKCKKRAGVWMCDVVMYPNPVIMEESAAPLFPYVLLTADRDTGVVISIEPVMDYRDGADELLRGLAGQMLEHGVPRQLEVMDERTYDLVKSIAAALRIKLEFLPNHPELEELESDFLERLENGVDEGAEEELMDIFEQFMEMDDEDLLAMPQGLWNELCILERKGLLPEEVARRVRGLDGHR